MNMMDFNLIESAVYAKDEEQIKVEKKNSINNGLWGGIELPCVQN